MSRGLLLLLLLSSNYVFLVESFTDIQISPTRRGQRSHTWASRSSPSDSVRKDDNDDRILFPKNVDWQKVNMMYLQNISRDDDTIMNTYTMYLRRLSTTMDLNPSEIAERAEEVLETMKHKPATMECLEAAFNCMARYNNNNNRGLITLDKMIAHLETAERNLGRGALPSVYLPVLQVAARNQGGKVAALRAKSLLMKLRYNLERTKDWDYAPTEAIYTAVLTAYSKIHPNEIESFGDDVDKIWKDMQTNPAIRRPSAPVYAAAINAITRADTVMKAKQAEHLLRTMEKPDSIAYRCVIGAYLRVNQTKEADALLWELQHLAEDAQSKTLAPPDRQMIEACILAWVQAFEAKKVGLVLVTDRLIKLADLLIKRVMSGTRNKANDSRAIQDYFILDKVMQIVARNHNSGVGETVERILRARQRVQARRGKLGPTLTSYVITIDAWVASRRRDAGCKAIALLREVDQLSEEGRIDGVNVRLLSTTLNAICISSKKIPREVEKLFQRVIELYELGDRSSVFDGRSQLNAFTYLMKNGSQQTAHRVLAFLDRLKSLSETMQDENIYPNVIVHNSVLTGFVHHGMSEEAETLVAMMEKESREGRNCSPDIVSYTNLIEATCMSAGKGKRNKGSKAEKILRTVEERSHQTDASIVLDTQLYNAVLKAYVLDASANSHTADDVERILCEMDVSAAGGMNTTPDLISFGWVAHAYGRSRSPLTVRKVYEILNRVDQLPKEGKLKYEPDYTFYSSLTTTLTAASNATGSMQLADIILERMSKCKGKNKPDLSLYNRILFGWSRSNEQARLERCKSILARMAEEGITPDLESYNSMIAAALTTTRDVSPRDRLHNFEYALHHFRAIHTGHLQPNSFTYAVFIRACRNLLYDREDMLQLVSKAFQLCRANGLVSSYVLVEVDKVAPSLLKDALTSSGGVLNENDGLIIPSEWCRNLDPSETMKKIPNLRIKPKHRRSCQ